MSYTWILPEVKLNTSSNMQCVLKKLVVDRTCATGGPASKITTSLFSVNRVLCSEFQIVLVC